MDSNVCSLSVVNLITGLLLVELGVFYLAVEFFILLLPDEDFECSQNSDIYVIQLLVLAVPNMNQTSIAALSIVVALATLAGLAVVRL